MQIHHVIGRLVRADLTCHLGLSTITVRLVEQGTSQCIRALRSYTTDQRRLAQAHMATIHRWMGMQVLASGMDRADLSLGPVLLRCADFRLAAPAELVAAKRAKIHTRRAEHAAQLRAAA